MSSDPFTTREWFVYTDDNDADKAVLLPAWIGKEAKLGFTESDGSQAPLDDHRRMRRILVAHPTDGRKRYLPVGDKASDSWATPGTTILIKERGDVTGTSWTIMSLHAEKPARISRNIHSYA